jgi:hypothetical protein
VRRWVVSSTDRTGWSAVATPTAILQLVEWLVRALRQTTLEDVPEAWFGCTADELVQTAMAGEAPLLRSLLERTVQLIRNAPTQSSRDEMLDWLYTAVVWHLRGPYVAHAWPRRRRASAPPRRHMEHLLLPQMIGSPVGGIPRLTGMTLHHDVARREWYLCTDGSNFVGLYTQWNGLAIDRRRCFTTNQASFCFPSNRCLPPTSSRSTHAWASRPCAPCSRTAIWPVHWGHAFAYGGAKAWLRVNNASCKLLVDHLSSRGTWRGVNRTSIIVSAAVLASVTVEDPIKHMRHAAFLGTCDTLAGSSSRERMFLTTSKRSLSPANVLTGGPITFGTSGMAILLDLDRYMSPMLKQKDSSVN